MYLIYEDLLYDLMIKRCSAPSGHVVCQIAATS